MNGADVQSWATLAMTVVLFVRTFVGDGKKAVKEVATTLSEDIARCQAENQKLRADLSDFQLKVATEYARNEQISPRLDRIENLLMQALGLGRKHD